MNSNRILIIDDEAEVRNLISDVLADEGYSTATAATEQEAIFLIKNDKPDLVFLDLWIENDEAAGMKILAKIKAIHSDVPVVIISGHGTIDVAVQAIQNGAFDFIEKPFVIDRLLITCKRALELYQLKSENYTLKNNKLDTQVFSVGKSKFAQTIQHTISKISSNNSRIFIESHTGMGTEVLALEIHKLSQRKAYPFIHINCVTDNQEQLEAELFGSEKNYGYIEKANKGTLFLEGISELSKNNQRRLLQFLQDGSCMLGSRQAFSDVRILSSSNKNINDLMQNNLFSQELFYRLNIVTLSVPSIEDRREDIIPIVNYYLKNSHAFFGIKSKNFTDDALAILQAYNWPGNIHQIKNIVESSLINSADSNVVDKTHLPPELTSCAKDKFTSLDIANFISLPLKEAKELFEIDYLSAQIERFSGNISKTANFIGMERSALHRKLKLLGLQHSKTSESDGDRKS